MCWCCCLPALLLSQVIVDEYQAVSFLKSSAEIWVQLRLQIITCFLTLGIFIIGFLSGNQSNAGPIGLSLTASIQFATSVYKFLMNLALGEAEMNAVERLTEYGQDLPQEKDYRKGGESTDLVWPTKGEIIFESYSLFYPSTPEKRAINDLDLVVKAGEHLGIVGRTGSGKSSLINGLFRILESKSGRILIDGVDLSNLGLRTLRSRIEIVPQDPSLLKGTLRSNLDPFRLCEDNQIWDALKIVDLQNLIPGVTVDTPIDDNGNDLSIGQKQMIYFAGVFLHKPKILVLDEATSSG